VFHVVRSELQTRIYFRALISLAQVFLWYGEDINLFSYVTHGTCVVQAIANGVRMVSIPNKPNIVRNVFSHANGDK
jgi:hypothetical protein